MQLMQQMMNQMSTMQCQPINTTQQSSNHRPSNNKWNPNQQLYCWRHGACNHRSKDCRDKGEGHQDDATFENHMGGSTKNIPNEWLLALKNNIQSINKTTHNKTETSVNTNTSSNVPISKLNHTVVLKADSGATNHYFKKEDMAIFWPKSKKFLIQKQSSYRIVPISLLHIKACYRYPTNCQMPQKRCKYYQTWPIVHCYQLANFVTIIVRDFSTKKIS